MDFQWCWRPITPSPFEPQGWKTVIDVHIHALDNLVPSVSLLESKVGNSPQCNLMHLCSMDMHVPKSLVVTQLLKDLESVIKGEILHKANT